MLPISTKRLNQFCLIFSAVLVKGRFPAKTTGIFQENRCWTFCFQVNVSFLRSLKTAAAHQNSTLDPNLTVPYAS